jgi:hypothetical protein
MAREIKRLSDRSDPFFPSVEQLIKRDPAAWQKELSWWSSIGVNRVMLLMLLESARVGRKEFEERLDARVDPGTTREIRDARRALKRQRVSVSGSRRENPQSTSTRSRQRRVSDGGADGRARGGGPALLCARSAADGFRLRSHTWPSRL